MVTFAINDNEEMLEISVDGTVVFYGNFWDYQKIETTQLILKALGVAYEEIDLADIG